MSTFGGDHVSELRPLLTGLKFPESPRWHSGRLWLADWGAQEVIAVDLQGTSEVVGHVASFPFSIDWLPDGRMLAVSAAQCCLLRAETNGEWVTHSDLSSLSQRPWNEIVVDGRGSAYLNNIGFNFPGGEFAPGIVALVTAGGSVLQVADDVAFPNGMAVTPDNTTLIVAESYANRLTAFDIGPDGTLSNKRTWADVGDDHPDGICMDVEGAVWCADVGNKHCVRVAEGGEVLQTVEHDRACFACMLGGPDRRTLFVVANEWGGPSSVGQPADAHGQLLAVSVSTVGAGWP
jgi:sugar lactone lactonase YvrE